MPQSRIANNFARLRVPQRAPEISTLVFTFLTEDGLFEQWLPFDIVGALGRGSNSNPELQCPRIPTSWSTSPGIAHRCMRTPRRGATGHFTWRISRLALGKWLCSVVHLCGKELLLSQLFLCLIKVVSL